jgi:hypothetical protein
MAVGSGMKSGSQKSKSPSQGEKIDENGLKTLVRAAVTVN